jgi:hypothetical protein
VVVDGLKDEAQTLDVVEAALFADLPAAHAVNALDSGMLIVGDGG